MDWPDWPSATDGATPGITHPIFGVGRYFASTGGLGRAPGRPVEGLGRRSTRESPMARRGAIAGRPARAHRPKCHTFTRNEAPATPAASPNRARCPPHGRGPPTTVSKTLPYPTRAATPLFFGATGTPKGPLTCTCSRPPRSPRTAGRSGGRGKGGAACLSNQANVARPAPTTPTISSAPPPIPKTQTGRPRRRRPADEGHGGVAAVFLRAAGPGRRTRSDAESGACPPARGRANAARRHLCALDVGWHDPDFPYPTLTRPAPPRTPGLAAARGEPAESFGAGGAPSHRPIAAGHYHGPGRRRGRGRGGG